MYRIKELRLEKGWSQRELARRINASPKTVNFWENDVNEPSASFVIALANAFECTTDYLLAREDDYGVVNVMRELSADEMRMIAKYSSLDKDERKNLMLYAEFMEFKHRP